MIAAQRHAVVVGAGIAGLSSALLLARAGWKVTLLEQHNIPGGLMQTYHREGKRWDTGFHFATAAQPGGLFRRCLQYFGIRDKVEFFAPVADAQFVFHGSDGRQWTLPIGIDASEAAMCDQFPRQAAACHRFFNELRGQLNRIPWLGNLEGGEGFGDAERSAAQVLADCGCTGDLARCLGGLGTILGIKPETIPFDTYAAVCGTSLMGSYRMSRGGDGFIRPMLKAIRAHGGDIHLANGAEAILWDAREATAVVDKRGDVHSCDLVVAACHPTELFRLCGADAFRPSFRKKIQTLPDSVSAFGVQFALPAHKQTFLPQHHLFQRDDGREAYAVFPASFESRPESFEVMQWVSPEVTAWTRSRLAERPASYEAWKQEEAESLVEETCRYIPGLKELVQHGHAYSPLTIRDYARSRNGAAFGLSHDVGYRGAEGLGNRNKLRNVLLVGQSVSHPGILGTILGAVGAVSAVTGISMREHIRATAGD